MKKLVLFDCDGVLVNSEEAAFAAATAYAAQYGFRFDDSACIEMISGLSLEDMVAVLNADYAARTGENLPPHFPDDLRESYRESLRDIRAVDGVPALLQTLRRSGTAFCVASNSERDSLEQKLHTTGLYDFFYPHIYSKDDVTRPKPFPDLYLHAAKDMGGYDPAECFVIEDSATGVRAGHAAGMCVIAYAGGAHRPKNFGATLEGVGAACSAETMNGVARLLYGRLGLVLPADIPRPRMPGPF